jgi:cation/acetate symporter
MDSVQVWTYVLVTITFMAYLGIGWSARVRESSGFFVAGRGVPAIANGAATAADWMSAASFISMTGLISTMGYDGAIYLMGWTGGYVLLALLLAPYLRKYGKYTVPDFVGDRYYSTTARLVAVVAALFVSITYVAGQMRGVGIVFSKFLEVGINQGIFVGMAIVAFFAVLGGMKGITWTQVAQYAVLILAFLIPSVAISYKLTGNPIPQLSLVGSDIMTRLNDLQVELGFSEYTQPFQSKTKLDIFCITVALMAGTAGLPHVIVRFYTVPTVRAARWSGFWALLFIALLYTTSPALATFARYNLLNTLNGARIERIEQREIAGATKEVFHLAMVHDGIAEPIEWAAKWQVTDLLKFEDKDGDGSIRIAKDAAISEVIIDKDIIVLSTPEVAALPAWVIALVAAGGLAAALSTAAGLLLVISSSVAHDLYYRLINPRASEARRVMVGRICIVGAVIVAGLFGVMNLGFVAQVVAFAFGLAAASFFPVIILGIFDSRTNRQGAIAGMIVGLTFVVVYIVGNKAAAIFGTNPWFGPWFFGISPEGIGAVGMLLNLAVTLVVSRLTPPPPAEVQAMVESLRDPEHAGPALELEEDHLD